MKWWHIWLITRLSGVQGLFTGVAVASGVAAAVALCVWLINAGFAADYGDREDDRAKKEVATHRSYAKTGKKHLKPAIIICIITAICAVLIPNTKEAVAIYVIPMVANDEQVQAIPEKGLELLNLKFDEWIGDMQETVGKAVKEEIEKVIEDEVTE